MKLPLSYNIRQKEYIDFIYKVSCFLLILFILDFAAGSILEHFYFKQKSGLLYRASYSINETNEDLLIFGSSKATHQYNPDVFEKHLNLSYCNVGRDGSSIIYQYAVLKAILQRYSPKMIILSVGREFEKENDSYDRLSMLLPYYGAHPEMHSIIELRSPYEKFKLLSKVYPYNSLLFSIIAGNMEMNKARYEDIKGYIPLSKIWNKPLGTISSKDGNYELDSIKIGCYESFIKDCIESNVKLYIVSSPHFYKLDFIEKSESLGKEIAQKYNVRYLDYAEDSMFLSTPGLFADGGHLNKTGAIIFSNIIAEDINQDIQSKGYKMK